MPLAFIINMSFLTGEYPDLLKVVKVIPIPKGSSTQDINNYRPITTKYCMLHSKSRKLFLSQKSGNAIGDRTFNLAQFLLNWVSVQEFEVGWPNFYPSWIHFL